MEACSAALWLGDPPLLQDTLLSFPDHRAQDGSAATFRKATERGEGRRTLVVVPTLPLPTRGGVDLRNWEIVKALASMGSVAVFGLAGGSERAPGQESIEVWRTSDDPELGPRIERALGSSEWAVGHPSDAYFAPQVVGELHNLIATFRPTLVVFEQIWTHHYIEAVKGEALPVVLDAHNVEGALDAEIAWSLTRGRQVRLRRAELAERLGAIERSAFRRVDQLWLTSQRDARLASDRYGETAPKIVVPNAVDVDSYRGRTPNQRASVPEQPTIVLAGTFAYPPNVVAARFLVEEVLPRLWKRLPAARLQLVGREPPGFIRAAAEREPRIEVTGAVPDTKQFFAEAFAAAVPLFQGGGTRLKVLEAFAAGTPVVATTKAVEGLDVREGTHYLPAERPEEFAEAIAAIWADPARAGEIAARAVRLVQDHYSSDVVRRCVSSAVGSLEATTWQRSPLGSEHFAGPPSSRRWPP